MTYVFVYGTLKRGESNNYLLAEADFVGEATSVAGAYEMFDGNFPRVVDRRDGHPIAGEVFAVDRATLRRLDRLEGHPRWYVRKRRSFRLPNGARATAWVYVMRRDLVDAGAPRVRPTLGVLAWRPDAVVKFDRAERRSRG